MHNNNSVPEKLMTYNPALMYLQDEDRYLTAKEAPAFVIGIIGVGINGQEHMRNVAFEGRAKVKGFYDKSPNSTEIASKNYAEFSQGETLKVYKSIKELCSDPEIDAVIISTPNFTHIEVVREVIQYNKHILLEKPMASNVKDAWEIVKISQEYEPVFQIGLQYRYKSIYREAIHEILERKILGIPKTISMCEHRIPFLDKVDQWNKFSENSGGTLVEKCCHYFDLINLFAQSKPVSVYATGALGVNYTDFEYKGKSSDIVDNALAIIEYENGVRASFSLCMFAPMVYEELVVCGENGRLSASEKDDFAANEGLLNSLHIVCNDGSPSRNIQTHYPKLIENSGHHGATFFEHIRFIDNMKGTSTDSASVEEGFWAVVVGAAAEESIAKGEKINIKAYLQKEGIQI